VMMLLVTPACNGKQETGAKKRPKYSHYEIPETANDVTTEDGPEERPRSSLSSSFLGVRLLHR